jgi:hypothetical protein
MALKNSTKSAAYYAVIEPILPQYLDRQFTVHNISDVTGQPTRKFPSRLGRFCREGILERVNGGIASHNGVLSVYQFTPEFRQLYHARANRHNENHVTNPQAIRTENRQAANRKTWNSKAWIRARNAFLNGKSCAWCGKRFDLIAHHPTLDHYGTPEYIDPYLSRCVVLCRRSHLALHKGMKLCPVCKERYCPVDAESCYECLPEQEKFSIEQKKRDSDRLKRKLQEKEKARVKAWKEAHK